ncbi:TetR family transcriptional regulator [Nocardia sp. NPDC051981]|uniref:TetR/AcrR family transcriptional regulator n=1 Tax=Nocardia sp. NPDC051981 TaxID=3155417 RepID=UPI003444D98A
MTERRHRPSALARRAALLKAAVEVAAEVGVAGVTHRAVTEKAGLPLTTVGYFFDSIDALTEEALRVYTEEDADTQIAIAESLAEAQGSPDEIAAAFSAAATPRTPETLALFEAYLHAARRPESRDAVTRALTAARRAAAAGARAAGAPDPDAMAPAFTALAHGLALHEMASPGSLPPDTVHAAFRAMFLGFLLDSGHIEPALQLRRQSAPQE